MLYGGVLCKTGLKRAINQDRAKLMLSGEAGLCFVADGMGGHYAGENASGAIEDALSLWWERFHQDAPHWPIQELSESLKTVLYQSAAHIRAQTPPDQFCGSTIVLLWLSLDHYLLLSAGDSRCYRIRSKWFGTEIQQLTKDDVYHAKETSDFHLEGKLTNAISSEAEAIFTVQTGIIHKHTMFALCSDGIYRYCKPSQLAQNWTEAARTGDIQTALEKIDDLIISNGAPDNYSMILLRRE